MSEQNEIASDRCEFSEDPRDTDLPPEGGGTYISHHLKADGEKELSPEEEAKIIERLRSLGYL